MQSSSSSPRNEEHRQQSTYSLRENPKKTSWWLSTSSDADDGGLYQCRECGKCLSSWTSLCEHTRIHCDDERMQLGDQCSNLMAVPKRRRGSRGQARSVAACSSSSASDSLSIQNNCEDEGEYEAVEALIMLSRGPLGCCSESSDKNSSVADSGNAVEACIDAELSSSDSEFATNGGFGECGGISLRKIGSFDVSVSNGGSFAQKSSSFECKDCHKVFGSFRALGGHRAGQKRKKGGGGGCCTSAGLSVIDESPDRPCSISAGSKAAQNKRKVHMCEVCAKVFGSGWALGRHKRCHLMGKVSENAGVADSNVTEIQIQQQPIAP